MHGQTNQTLSLCLLCFTTLAAMMAVCEIFNLLHFRSTPQGGGGMAHASGPMVNTPVALSPPCTWGWKTQNGRFRCKFAFRLKTVWYKVLLSENCQRQSFVRHSLGYLSMRKWLVGATHSRLPEILGQTDRVGAKSPIFTALHGMQTRSSDENSVRLSVLPSVRPSVRLSHAWIVTKQ